MSRRWFRSSVLLWILCALSSVIGEYVRAQDLCDAAWKELHQEKQRLNDYLSAFQQSHERQDLRLAEVLKFKISQSKKKLQDLQLIIKNCPSRESSLPADGLSNAKSHDGPYADKSCAELKKMLFPLLVSKRALERRQKSMLSNLTDEEDEELREISDKLRHLKKALKNRCSTSKGSRSLLKLRRR